MSVAELVLETYENVALRWFRAPQEENAEPEQETEMIHPRQRKLWKESFKGFYEKHSRALWFYIFKTCGDEQLADDVFQEAFYRFLRSEPIGLNEFQQRAFLYKTATRLIIDHKRKEDVVRRKTVVEREFDVPKEEQLSLSMDMEKHFHLLKPKERTLLWLAYVEGYSHAEIANIIGAGEKSIKVQLFRVRKKFADILRQKGYNSGG